MCFFYLMNFGCNRRSHIRRLLIGCVERVYNEGSTMKGLWFGGWMFWFGGSSSIGTIDKRRYKIHFDLAAVKDFNVYIRKNKSWWAKGIWVERTSSTQYKIVKLNYKQMGICINTQSKHLYTSFVCDRNLTTRHENVRLISALMRAYS